MHVQWLCIHIHTITNAACCIQEPKDKPTDDAPEVPSISSSTLTESEKMSGGWWNAKVKQPGPHQGLLYCSYIDFVVA